MPKYYFNIQDTEFYPDEEGQELADHAAAFKEAISAARELACGEVMRGQLEPHHRIEVVDEDGQAVATVTYADAAGIVMDGIASDARP